jgi:hypothetical protein
MDFLLILLIFVIVFVLLVVACMSTWTYAKPKVMKYVQGKIMQNLPKHSHPAELNLNEAGTCGKLVYTHKNKEYVMYLPYDKKLFKKIGYTVIHKLGDVSVDITQQAGIPYLVTADSLGGGVVEVYKDDDLMHTFKEGEAIRF